MQHVADTYMLALCVIKGRKGKKYVGVRWVEGAGGRGHAPVHVRFDAVRGYVVLWWCQL